MIGELGENKKCPSCGGRLKEQWAAIPFLLPNAIVLIKDVPAEVCSSCHEPYTTGQVTDRIVRMLNPLRILKAEVLILSYTESEPDMTPVTAMTA